MRVNGFLSHVGGITCIRLYDERCVYVNNMPVNEYFNECYDASFADYDIKHVSIQDGILCIAIVKADKSQLACRLETLREQLESLQEDLVDFEEHYL